MKEKQAKGMADNQKMIRKATLFFSDNERAIADYAQRVGLVFEPGERWTIDVESGRGTFDPVFFVKRGYAEAESMWAVCHAIEHIRDWRRDPEAYAALYAKAGQVRRTGLLYQYINDILANREEDRRFPAHRETRAALYQVKLLPRVNYLKTPRHIQLITAMLRERIIPEEPLSLSPEVRTALKKLKNYDGEGTNLIDLATDPTVLPRNRFLLVRDYIEPVYEALFQKDIEERKNKKKKEPDRGGDPMNEESVEGGTRSIAKGFIESSLPDEKEYFSEEYNEAIKALAGVFSPDEAREKIEKAIQRLREENKSPQQIARDQFKVEHGVTVEEAEDYAEEYKKIAHQIEPLREVFGRIIATRKETKRRLRERTDQGVIIDPSMMVQAYIDANSGVRDSRTQLKIKKEEFDEHTLNEFEFSLTCDLSGSMNENWPGGKSYEQKLSAILIIEALDEFEKRLKEERLEKSLDLHIRTEVRGFHAFDEELKSLSDFIDFAGRVKISRRLEYCTGANTADYTSLVYIAAMMDAETEMKIRKGVLRKVVLLITDGGSDDVLLTKEARRRLISKGIVTGAIQIGQPGKSDSEKFKQIWGSDGLPCRDVSRLVPVVEGLLEGFLKNL